MWHCIATIATKQFTSYCIANHRLLSMYIYVIHGMPLTMQERPAAIDKVRRHEVITRAWEDQHLFDQNSHYRYFADDVPEISSLQSFLARTIYNPVVRVHAEWRRVGDFDQKELIAAVKKGLDHDDDIIQQWFDKNEVMKLLYVANSWDEVILAVEAIGGGHGDTSAVAAYIKRVLKKT